MIQATQLRRGTCIKPARLATGRVAQVPPFTSEGDVVRVDTSTGACVERVRST